MRIAVIGMGNIGGTLGDALAAGGHDVVFGSRNPERSTRGDSAIRPVDTALAGAEAVLLAIPAAGVPGFLAENAQALDGALVIDATNDISGPVANAATAIAAAAPGARYVRAFNTLGWENFADPVFDGQPADLLYSSAEADRPAIEELIDAVGLRPVYLGPDKQDVVDGLLPIWFALWQQRGHRHLAFRVVEK